MEPFTGSKPSIRLLDRLIYHSVKSFLCHCFPPKNKKHLVLKGRNGFPVPPLLIIDRDNPTRKG